MHILKEKGGGFMQTAEVFKSGNSQAIRLPKKMKKERYVLL